MTFGKQFGLPSPSNNAGLHSSNLIEKLNDNLEVYTGLPWSGAD